MATYRKIKMEIGKGNGYGQYIIHALYKGKNIVTHTTDSEAYDYLNNEDNAVKHREAKQHCYFKIVQAYNDEHYYEMVHKHNL